MGEADIINIWKSLHDNQVRYLTIGGFAVIIHGYNRTTGDLDILVENSLDNRKKLRKALNDIGFGDFEQIESMEFIPGWTDFIVGPGLRLDVMTSVKGVDEKDFDELYRFSEVTVIENINVRVIDYKNLIKIKQASNRTKDQLDIEELEKIKKWSEEL
jgi:hypothetical protein